MPEGDSIWLSAQRLRPLLDGEELTFADARHRAHCHGLVGARCGPLETIGKHLLMTFEGGGLAEPIMLRVHLGMKGRWKTEPAQGRPPTNFDRVGLVLQTRCGRAVLSYPLQLERFLLRERYRQHALHELGPDLLAQDFSPGEVAERALERAHANDRRAQTLHQMLLDQRTACGIGNVYKSETLFLERQNPFALVTETPVRSIEGLYARAMRLMRANLRPGLRNTTGRARPRYWVYEGQRRGCLRCGTPVSVAQEGSGEQVPRLTWWCPHCQK